MDQLVEAISRAAVLVFYAAAFIMALAAHRSTEMWARKISTVGIMLTAAGWLIFYIAATDFILTSKPVVVLWSRIFHYNAATWLFVMALVIYQADKYGIQAAFKREPHG